MRLEHFRESPVPRRFQHLRTGARVLFDRNDQQKPNQVIESSHGDVFDFIFEHCVLSFLLNNTKMK